MLSGRSLDVNVYSLIRQAIIDKSIVVATYDGHVRELCPHILGTKKIRRNTTWRCFGYQIGGGSKHGLAKGGEWRCFILDKLQNVSIRKAQLGEWKSGDSHKHPQSCIEIIVEQVKFDSR